MRRIVEHNTVRFLRYRQGIAYYGVDVPSADRPLEREPWMFPVPLEDVGDATLEREDKAILFMRWIRRAIEDGSFVRAI